MAAFYTDEDVTLALEEPLRARGHLVASTDGEGRRRSPDPHQVLYAAERDWTLITHNRRDYRLLHDAWHLWAHAWKVPYRHAGIIVLEQLPRHPAAEIADLIHGLVVDAETSLANALYDWRQATGWRRFPD
ncbi:MAG: DUF5615 family PIN-like protein [Thermomicrobiales bacterium]